MERHEAPTGLEIAGLVGVVTLATAALASLVLAWGGVHEGLTALVIGVAAGGALAVVALRRGRDWRLAPWSWVDAGLLAAVLGVAAVQFFPGFPLAAKNRDPGVYVNHAVAIADQGSAILDDPVFDTGAEVELRGDEPRIVTAEGDVAWRRLPYRAFPTDPDQPEEIQPDFFHLWPTTLATAMDLGGRGALFNATPFFALAAVGAFWLAVRRAYGPLAATVAGGLLAVNEIQVWQAKFPTAEALSELLYAGALLAVALALATRWRLAAAAGGFLVGMGFVARPEGIIVVGLAAVVVALLWAFAAEARVRLAHPVVLFGVGMVPPLLLGAYQAYGRDSRYAELQEGLPSFPQSVAGFALLVVGAVVLRFLVAPRTQGIDRGRALRLAGYGLVGLFAAFLLFAWFRPELLGENLRIDKSGNRTRGYDELNLRRLAWFVTPLTLVAAVGALTVGVRERWSAVRWVLVVPGVLLAPILIWEPHIAPNLMWWTRRYAPVVVPTLLILVGVAAAWLWSRRRPLLRLGTAALVLAMGAYALRQSNDLWGHRELDGSLQVIDAIDEVVGDDGVVVWQGGGPLAASLAITPFTWLGLPAVSGPPSSTPDELLALQDALGGRPLFLVTESYALPPRLAALEPVAEIDGELSQFEQSLESRPRRAHALPVDLTVWRLTDP